VSRRYCANAARRTAVLRKRIEKLEAHLPPPSATLLERLDRKALNSLSGNDRVLVTQMLNTSDPRKVWATEYRAAEVRYLDNYGMLLQEISDDELARLIAQLESQIGHPLSELEAIA
jgi:hypothetical protein